MIHVLQQICCCASYSHLLSDYMLFCVFASMQLFQVSSANEWKTINVRERLTENDEEVLVKCSTWTANGKQLICAARNAVLVSIFRKIRNTAVWMQASVCCSVVFIKVGHSECEERKKRQSHRVCCVLHAFDFCASWSPYRLGSDLSSLGHCLRCLMWKHQTCCWRSKRAAWAWYSTAMPVRPVTYWLLLSQTTLWRYSFLFYNFLVLKIRKVLTIRCAGPTAVGFRSQ